jgi:hypothetical protein
MQANNYHGNTHTPPFDTADYSFNKIAKKSQKIVEK